MLGLGVGVRVLSEGIRQYLYTIRTLSELKRYLWDFVRGFISGRDFVLDSDLISAILAPRRMC